MEIDRYRLQDEAYRTEVVERLMRDHAEAIMRHCTTWLGEGLADELTQEVFITAWQQLPKYRPNAPIHAWLFGIARNKCQQAYRNHARRRTIAHTFAEDIRQRVHAESPSSPEHTMTHEAQGAKLHDGLHQLRDEDRIMLTLRYWKEQPIAEIADIMGKSESAVRKRLGRAVQRLREMMQDVSKD